VEKLRTSNPGAIKNLYDRLLEDNDLEENFFSCVSKAMGNNNLSDKHKKGIWKYLLMKTYHSRIGVVTDCFADDTTGCYATESNTDSMHPILKIKTCQTTIEKVKKKSWWKYLATALEKLRKQKTVK